MTSVADTPVNLAGLSPRAMQAFFADLGEKPFRAGQVTRWIHQRGVTDIDAMTDISKSLRSRLAEVAEIRLPRIVEEHYAEDGCIKWLVEVASGSRVETVYIPEADRATLCISSQAGCALDCSFCATGKQGFNSNLTVAEIIGQLWWANKLLGGFRGTEDRPVSNVVMMGMGEPLLNFDNVIDAVNLMMDDLAYGLSKRRVTISTSGVVPALQRMCGLTDASLAVSLHAPDDDLRSQLMPINRRYPIAELLEAVRQYMDSLPDRRIPVIEYTLIAGVNDHLRQARDLARLLRGFPCKINLIPFNPFAQSDLQRPTSATVNAFRQALQDIGYVVTVRTTRGDDIGGACGQLVGAVQDQTLRSARLQRKREGIPVVNIHDSTDVGVCSGRPG